MKAYKLEWFNYNTIHIAVMSLLPVDLQIYIEGFRFQLVRVHFRLLLYLQTIFGYMFVYCICSFQCIFIHSLIFWRLQEKTA